jgi:hypothetical protein
LRGTKNLTKQLTVRQAEAKYLFDVKSTAFPFGYANEDWNNLKQSMIPGDELWEFCECAPNGETFEGIKLVRQGKVVASIVSFLKHETTQETFRARKGGSRKRRQRDG